MIAWLVVLLMWLAVPAWGQHVVVDQAGRDVDLPSVVERVVCLQGGTSWIAYALGAADLLVGAYFVSLPTAPLAQAALEGVDPAYLMKELPVKPTVEAIVALRPDVVFASSAVHGEAFAELLEEVGIPTLLYYPETLDGVEDAIRLTGRALGRESRADGLATRFRELITGVESATAGLAPRPRVYFAAYTATNVYAGDVIQNALIELSGGDPLGKVLAPRPGLFWQRVDAEQVLVWDPEVVCVPSYSRAKPADFLADPVWSSVAAIRAGNVFAFPEFFAAWDIPGPEVVLGLLWLAETLHPGSTGLDLVAEIVRFYSEFYGCDLAADEIALLLQR